MERVNYETLKRWFFEDAFLWCKRNLEEGGVKNKEFTEWGAALDSFDGSFYTPIENLMLNVIYIITNSGRHFYSHNIILKKIDSILCENDLNKLTSELNDDERDDFLYDLNLVLNNRDTLS